MSSKWCLLLATGALVTLAGCSTNHAPVNVVQPQPSVVLRIFPSRLPTIPPLLSLLLLNLPYLSTTLFTSMEIGALQPKTVHFVVRTATTAICLILSVTSSNGALLMLPADAYPTSALPKATPTLILNTVIIKMVSAMDATTAA